MKAWCKAGLSTTYYRAGEEDDLRRISRLVNVAQSAIQRWNNLVTPDIEAGDILQIGWIAYDKYQVPFANNATMPVTPPVATTGKPPVSKTPVTNPAATVKKPAPVSTPAQSIQPDDDDTLEEVSAYAQLYDQQTSGNTNFNEEQGAAVFYPLKTKVGPGVYYAFHNTAARGSILKIMNPASGKIIYAKVIGTLPNLKEYHNAVIGLSNNSIGVLGATDQRMFCKIKYR
ncbi:MAG: LysM peptidoglycan-binding domain-containing protein [Sphingobacteriales bacterium]|nr:MAG: LysM peptidoglycan-binding domain-containing protein [Sphingobacteriales bacterium]